MTSQEPIATQEWGECALRAARDAVPSSCTNEADRDDIVSETVARLLRYRSKPLRAHEVRVLARRIARNIWIDLVRERRGRTREESIADDQIAAPGPGVGRPDAERSRVIDAMVASLTAEERRAVWLHFVEGLSLRATARAMGVPVGNVRRRLGAALSSMKAHAPPGDRRGPVR